MTGTFLIGIASAVATVMAGAAWMMWLDRREVERVRKHHNGRRQS